MSYLTFCPKGHQYVAADVYKDWPADKPKCPHCRAGVPDMNNTWRLAVELRRLADEIERHGAVREYDITRHRENPEVGTDAEGNVQRAAGREHTATFRWEYVHERPA